jgi:hypothetical protein
MLYDASICITAFNHLRDRIPIATFGMGSACPREATQKRPGLVIELILVKVLTHADMAVRQREHDSIWPMRSRSSSGSRRHYGSTGSRLLVLTGPPS